MLGIQTQGEHVISILALNLAAPPVTRAKDLLAWLWLQPELVWVLTDSGKGAGGRLIKDVCLAAGYAVEFSEHVIVVSRERPLTAIPSPSPRTCAAEVEGLRLLGVYGAASDPVRYSSAAQRQRKRQWLAEFEPMLASYDVVVGDLNIAPAKSLPYVLDEEVAVYERSPLRDAWSLLHEDEQPSWIDHSGVGIRYDQAWVGDVEVISCELDQHPRESGLSDHAALRLALSTGPAPT